MTYSGVVMQNSGRGRQIGFPTANIEIDPDAPEGIFVGFTHINDRDLPSLIFIGSPITFEDKKKRAETYILDFEADLYGEEIMIKIVEKLRDNEKFDSEQDLINQMVEDEKNAREYFAQNTN